MDKSYKNKISLIKLGGRLKEAASLAALCMADNEYYLKLYGGLSRERRIALMEERIAKTVGYCAENDGAFGVCAADGRLAAYEYMVDYRRLAEGSPEFYNFIFSSEGSFLPFKRGKVRYLRARLRRRPRREEGFPRAGGNGPFQPQAAEGEGRDRGRFFKRRTALALRRTGQF